MLVPEPFGAESHFIVPNINHLATPPFTVILEDKYVYFYRLHLAQDLDIDFDSKERLLKFNILSATSLLPQEMEKSLLFETNKNFHATEKEDKLLTLYHFRVPDDARLDDSLIRNDIDTNCGCLVEVHLLRTKEANKSNLKGKRFSHLIVNVQSKNQLDHQVAQQQ